MIQRPPPEDEGAARVEDPEAAPSHVPGQMSIYDLIDECANALGVWGPSDNHDGGARYRRLARRRS